MQCSFPHPPLPQNSSKILLYWMVYVNRWWAFWFWIHSGVGESWQYDNPLFHGRIFLVCIRMSHFVCSLGVIWCIGLHLVKFATINALTHWWNMILGLHQPFLNEFLFFFLWHNWRSSIGRCEKKIPCVFEWGFLYCSLV